MTTPATWTLHHRGTDGIQRVDPFRFEVDALVQATTLPENVAWRILAPDGRVVHERAAYSRPPRRKE